MSLSASTENRVFQACCVLTLFFWEHSCVRFFFMGPHQVSYLYYNISFNGIIDYSKMQPLGYFNYSFILGFNSKMRQWFHICNTAVCVLTHRYSKRRYAHRWFAICQEEEVTNHSLSGCFISKTQTETLSSASLLPPSIPSQRTRWACAVGTTLLLLWTFFCETATAIAQVVILMINGCVCVCVNEGVCPVNTQLLVNCWRVSDDQLTTLSINVQAGGTDKECFCHPNNMS